MPDSVELVTARRGGRLRSDQARRAILATTAELIREPGLAGTSIEQIARTAGVSKATIYRWWKSKGALALEAYVASIHVLDRPDPKTGSLRGDLVAYIKTFVASLVEPKANRAFRQIIAEAQCDEILAKAFEGELATSFREPYVRIFDAAEARGEIPRTLDRVLLLDAIFGAIYHRVLLHHDRLDVRFLEDVVDLVLCGALPREQPGRQGKASRASARATLLRHRDL